MKNEIENIRENINRYFNPNNRLSREVYKLSQGGIFYCTIEDYKQNNIQEDWVITSIDNYQQHTINKPWIINKVEIWEMERKEGKIYEYLTDYSYADDHAYWFRKNNIDYLFLAESLQGQSIFDTKNKVLHSFYSKEEPFIWQKIYPSPNGNKIAVKGYYWGCPYEFRVYDSREITNLPYELIYQENNFNNDCIFEKWEDNHTIIFKKKDNFFTTKI